MKPASTEPVFDAVLLDLDGTLVDSRPGIVAAARGALGDLGLALEVPDFEGMLGKTLEDLVAAIAPRLDSSGHASLAAAFRRRYDADGWRASEPYPGVPETIDGLSRAGVRLFLVTNKRRVPTLRIVDVCGISRFIAEVYTPDSRVPGYASKGEMSRACMRDQGLRPQASLVVGDSREDRDMARESGASFAAAAWGYGNAASSLPAAQPRSLHEPARRLECVLRAMTDLLALVMTGESLEAVHEP